MKFMMTTKFVKIFLFKRRSLEFYEVNQTILKFFYSGIFMEIFI